MCKAGAGESDKGNERMRGVWKGPFFELICLFAHSFKISVTRFFFDSFRKGCFQASKREEGLKENTEREREKKKSPRGSLGRRRKKEGEKNKGRS